MAKSEMIDFILQHFQRGDELRIKSGMNLIGEGRKATFIGLTYTRTVEPRVLLIIDGTQGEYILRGYFLERHDNLSLINRQRIKQWQQLKNQ